MGEPLKWKASSGSSLGDSRHCPDHPDPGSLAGSTFGQRQSLFARALYRVVILSALLVSASAPAQGQAPTPHATAFRSLSSRAAAARDADRLDEAADLYRKALALNGAWSEGWWSLGTIYYDTDRFAEGSIAFKKVVELDPRHGTARAMLGLCEFELGDLIGALRDIEASKELGVIEDPQLRQVVLYHEGVLLQRAQRFEAAQKALSSLCMSGVKNSALIQTFGMVALRISDEKPPDPGTEDAAIVERIGRAACLGGQKNYDAARREFEYVVTNYPNRRYVHYAYGKLLRDASDHEGAIREFQREIEQQPGSALARLQIAAAYYRVNSAAGLPYAEEALKLAARAPFAHYLFGLLLLDTGEYAKSIPHLEIARQAFPQETKIYWSLGVAYAHAGRPKDAAEVRNVFTRLTQARQQDQGTGASEPADIAHPPEIPDAVNPSPD